jgi:hypothetical protein
VKEKENKLIQVTGTLFCDVGALALSNCRYESWDVGISAIEQ